MTSAKLAKNSVAAARIASGAVTGAKLANGAVGTSKIASSAVTAAQIAPATITAAQMAPASLNGSLFAAGQGPGVNPGKITVVGSALVGLPITGVPTTATATCPPGQKAIGGGVNVGSLGFVDATGPTPDGNGWSVVGRDRHRRRGAAATAVCAAQ